MREGTTLRVMAADRPYVEFYNLHSISLENFGSTHVHKLANELRRLLVKCDVTHHLPVKKTIHGKIGLKTPDVCCIPCGCGKMHVRQAGI